MNAGAQLSQSKTWTTADGRVLPIDEMDDAHVINVIAFLNAWSLQLYAAHHGMDLADAVDVGEAEAWLERTPLMHRLVERVWGALSIEDREAIERRNSEYERETGYRKIRPR